MNLSGVAVGAYANFFNVDPQDIAVVQDDLDLPTGQVRVRRKGSAGGHNGIKSVQEHLGTGEFPRFKIGIGHPAIIIKLWSSMFYSALVLKNRSL